LYAEDFGPGHTAAGRDRGVNVVGEKPAKSPGDTSDLPPTGEQLVEMEDKDAPRREKIRSLVDRDFGDFDDAVSKFTATAEQILEQPPPTGHPGVLVDTHSHWAPESPPNATPSMGGIAELTLVVGVLADHATHWAGRKMDEMKGRAEADANR
jgi:hypothetical protein